MEFSFPCPTCGNIIDYEGSPGDKFTCPSCRQKVQLPALKTATAGTILVTADRMSQPTAPPPSWEQPSGRMPGACWQCGSIDRMRRIRIHPAGVTLCVAFATVGFLMCLISIIVLWPLAIVGVLFGLGSFFWLAWRESKIVCGRCGVQLGDQW